MQTDTLYRKTFMWLIVLIIGLVFMLLLSMPVNAHRVGNGDDPLVYPTPTPKCQINIDNGLPICLLGD